MFVTPEALTSNFCSLEPKLTRPSSLHLLAPPSLWRTNIYKTVGWHREVASDTGLKTRSGEVTQVVSSFISSL